MNPMVDLSTVSPAIALGPLDGRYRAVQGAQGNGGGDDGEVDHAAYCGRLPPISARGAVGVVAKTGCEAGLRRR